jgi:Na+/H+ antiporter NhaC
MGLIKNRRGRKSFKKELKRQIKYAIAAAVGFLIAFAWRDSIYSSINDMIDKFNETARHALSGIYTAVIITIIGVGIIIASSRLLKD